MKSKKSKKQGGVLQNAGRKELVKNLKFLAFWACLFILIYYGTVLAFGWGSIEGFTAQSSQKILSAMGQKASLELAGEFPILGIAGKEIAISELCTGWLETAVLISAVLASIGIAWRKRIYGAIGALAFGFAFNQLRIVVSTMQLLSTDLQTAELTHDIFFRLSLLVVIAGFYYWWFKRSAKNERKQ